MTRGSIILVCVLSVGCESLEDRIALQHSDLPADREEAVRAMEERLKEEEARREETGEELSSEGREILNSLAARSRAEGGDPDPQVRAICLAVLARNPSWKDTAIFKDALEDPHWRCQWEAVQALHLKRDRTAAIDVVMLLETSKHPLVRLECIAYIRTLQIKEGIPALAGIVTNLLERNRSATAAWLALKELTGQDFSSDDFPAWSRWYRNYRGNASLQESPSGEGSTPAEGNGSGGGAPPEKR